MPGVIADPLTTIGLTVLAFAVFLALLGATTAIFRGIGTDRALALGLMVSQRNMGLMLAATDGVLPGATWLYFALSQYPIYLSPQLLKPIANGSRLGWSGRYFAARRVVLDGRRSRLARLGSHQ